MRQPIVLRTLLCLSLLLGLVATASAAPQRAAGAGRGQQGQGMERIKELLQSLNLTADQSKQIDQILDEAREEITQNAKGLKDATPEERRQKLQPIMKETLEKIRGVLTEEQKKQLREKMEERRQEKQAGKSTTQPSADIMPPATQPDAMNDTMGDKASDKAVASVARGPMLQRIADRLSKLDLSPEQKTKIDAILDDTAKQVQSLRADAGANADTTRQKATAIFQGTRQQIAAVLTPQQQEQFRALQQAGQSPKSDTNTDTTAAKAAAVPSTTQPEVAKSQTRSLFAGADAPPFRLTRLGGSVVTSDSFVNKPLVLIFGSYSCPTFRDKIDQIDQLTRRYQGRAAFLIVYTREAYPANEWEVQRNLTEQIKVEQHKSLADRQHMAKLAQDALKIQTDIAVDDIDDGVTDTYDAMPNGAYVLLNGKIVARQKWADPLGLPVVLDAAMKQAKSS